SGGSDVENERRTPPACRSRTAGRCPAGTVAVRVAVMGGLSGCRLCSLNVPIFAPESQGFGRVLVGADLRSAQGALSAAPTRAIHRGGLLDRRVKPGDDDQCKARRYAYRYGEAPGGRGWRGTLNCQLFLSMGQ